MKNYKILNQNQPKYILRFYETNGKTSSSNIFETSSLKQVLESEDHETCLIDMTVEAHEFDWFGIGCLIELRDMSLKFSTSFEREILSISPSLWNSPLWKTHCASVLIS